MKQEEMMDTSAVKVTKFKDQENGQVTKVITFLNDVGLIIDEHDVEVAEDFQAAIEADMKDAGVLFASEDGLIFDPRESMAYVIISPDKSLDVHISFGVLPNDQSTLRQTVELLMVTAVERHI